ncbi:deoxyribose-phosphate aldolase [Nakamurella flavida]|uniref:Deoxyribose-phosphate aldolase n=1 Tax=Nakamurella flavida TaxID=363630 RepID=A0A938YMK8_9ACTN|nr:deoxyribose-phosphate aldolase [Nakamurella flavida]MBM9475984.1 deoxyribose-phosphate aldolase [Nakamurella flavida]MBM9478356.1 deoxyribose-phosphate aldolase [Nakamurella flavida]MDP9777727.1 deoxyribose-phosphate aldolase [Nakamurella flavida]
MNRTQLAAFLDYTVLKPEATAADVRALCEHAAELSVFAVCVSPSRVQVARDVLAPGIGLATVCGFPSGAHESVVKAAEAARSIAQGATEVDMVVNLGLVKDGDLAAVQDDIAAVQQAVGGAGDGSALLKVIIESAALTDEEITACCRAAEAAGAAFVKTSTGFHPTGGASVHAVEVMAAAVGGRLGIKASGGIADARQAQALIAAGATRLGVSKAAAILDGLPA